MNFDALVCSKLFLKNSKGISGNQNQHCINISDDKFISDHSYCKPNLLTKFARSLYQGSGKLADVLSSAYEIAEQEGMDEEDEDPAKASQSHRDQPIKCNLAESTDAFTQSQTSYISADGGASQAMEGDGLLHHKESGQKDRKLSDMYRKVKFDDATELKEENTDTTQGEEKLIKKSTAEDASSIKKVASSSGDLKAVKKRKKRSPGNLRMKVLSDEVDSDESVQTDDDTRKAHLEAILKQELK